MSPVWINPRQVRQPKVVFVRSTRRFRRERDVPYSSRYDIFSFPCGVGLNTDPKYSTHRSTSCKNYSLSVVCRIVSLRAHCDRPLAINRLKRRNDSCKRQSLSALTPSSFGRRGPKTVLVYRPSNPEWRTRAHPKCTRFRKCHCEWKSILLKLPKPVYDVSTEDRLQLALQFSVYKLIPHIVSTYTRLRMGRNLLPNHSFRSGLNHSPACRLPNCESYDFHRLLPSCPSLALSPYHLTQKIPLLLQTPISPT